jgi:hypothetical protein
MKGDKISMKDMWFDWNEEEKTAKCMIRHEKNGPIFVGEAFCHEDDYDMVSPRTGQEIAYRRAKIKQLQHVKNYEIKPQLFALRHLYSCMNRSARFNPESYENTMLQRQIRLLEFDLTTANEMIKYERESLKAFIDNKDRMYKHIRKKRLGQE